ncbi:MAG: NAD(P)/FAD-dependent oxidoreductase, partial [Pseudomonadota bacterium]
MQDVIVIGGSFAGLSAALQLGRASVPVTVVDGGAPRNRTSPAAHGVPGWDGTAPDDILSRFRVDAGAHPSPTFVDGTVVPVTGQQDGFAVTLAVGDRLEGRRIVLAHGVRATLPDVPGVAELWGRSVLHCLYCHGFEVRGRPLAVLANHPMSSHQIQLLRAGWSDNVTALTGLPGGCALDDIAGTGHRVDPRRIERLSAAADGLKVTFAGGDSAPFAAAVPAPAVSLTGSPADRLGCT